MAEILSPWFDIEWIFSSQGDWMKGTFGKKQRDWKGGARKENLFWNIVLSSQREKWGKGERVFYGRK